MANPTITSAVVQTAGNPIVLTISINGTAPLIPAGGSSDIGVTVNSVPATITGVSVQSGTQLWIYVSTPITKGATVALYAAAGISIVELRNTDGLEVSNADGFAVTNNSTVLALAQWYHGNSAGVQARLAVDTTTMIWDLNNDGVFDVDVMLRDGLMADAQFNAVMRTAKAITGATFAVPITVGGVALPDLPDSNEVKLWFNDLSERQVTKLGNDHRRIQYADTAAPTHMDKVIAMIGRDPLEELKEAAEMGFVGLAVDGAKLVPPPGVFQSVPIVSAHPCHRW